MSKEADYIDIKDFDSIERALENAEIEYEQGSDNGITAKLVTDNVTFQFNDDGSLMSIEINE